MNKTHEQINDNNRTIASSYIGSTKNNNLNNFHSFFNLSKLYNINKKINQDFDIKCKTKRSFSKNVSEKKKLLTTIPIFNTPLVEFNKNSKKFKINNRDWEILEIDADALLQKYKEYDEQALYCFGYTKYDKQTIFINKEMRQQVKKQTLYHELMHCYIWSFANIHNEYSEEELCDISANSHDIIHKICEDYFELKGGSDDVEN